VNPGRFSLGDDEESHVERSAVGFIYALGVLSFAAAAREACRACTSRRRINGPPPTCCATSVVRARVVCETDYVRGRMMKTDVTVFPDGRSTLTTTNRGEAASRWVTQIQGKKVLRPVPPAGEPEAGE
jgi:hypothetical protein